MEEISQHATFERLFPEQLADRCASDALEASSGPVAYLYALYQQVRAIEEQGDPAIQIRLSERRPDIEKLVLDQGSVEDLLPALTLVINALTAKASAIADGALPTLLAQAIRPAQLPWHHALEQIKAVLKHKKLPNFELLQRAQRTYPNFMHGNLRTAELREAMCNACGLSPASQTLLLDSGSAASKGYLSSRFGIDDKLAVDQLSNVGTLSRQTGLSTEQVLDLLAVSGIADDGSESFTAVKRSTAYEPEKADAADAADVAGHLFGAAFINNGTAPALSLEDIHSGPGITLRIKGATAAHFGRMHKIMHLQHALQLPFADVDLLVMAALRAEGQTKDFHFTPGTLRALGVFIYLREKYAITAEQFAALIDGVAAYTTGEQLPLLDRVLDGPGAGQLASIGTPLKIDGRTFALDGQASDTSPLPGLCQAFALKEEGLLSLLVEISDTLKMKAPKLSLPLVSSLYRLSRLPRLLRRGLHEGLQLVALLFLSSPGAETQLTGQPTLRDDSSTVDILDVLIGLANLDQWLREQKISPARLLEILTPPTPMTAKERALRSVDAHIRKLVTDTYPQVKASRLTDEQIYKEPTIKNITPVSGSWNAALSAFIDEQGYIRALASTETKALQASLAVQLKGKLKNTGATATPAVNLDEVTEVLAELINNHTVKQEEVVRHLLSTAFGKDDDGPELTPAHALPLLRWAGKSCVDVLADIAKAASAPPESIDTEPLYQPSVELWDELTRYARAVKQLKLSAAGLNALMEQPQWFDLETANADSQPSATPPALTLELCYQVSRYNTWVARAQTKALQETDVLDYFRQYPASGDSTAIVTATERLSELIDWSEQDIKAALPGIELAKPAKDRKTLDDFLASLPANLLIVYNWLDFYTPFKGLGAIIVRSKNPSHFSADQQEMFKRFAEFMKENPGPLRVKKSQYLPNVLAPKDWNDLMSRKDKLDLQLELYEPGTATEKRSYTPSSLGDINHFLRLRDLCEQTGLSCTSLLDMLPLNDSAPYSSFDGLAKLLLAACDETDRERIEPALQERWRDALVAYLWGHGAPADPKAQSLLSHREDFSDLLLCDVMVGAQPKTCTVPQAISSLQHYLHRLFARLEPGYNSDTFHPQRVRHWRQVLGTYAQWKRWQQQLDHPENLIHYRNRPNKSKAFQELEVEPNQGKLDTDLLQTAVTHYLTKFEQTSNLQVVSGYLDGVNPAGDTYHFIGKTNTAPIEYYWRSLDMSLLGAGQQPNPLAWSEWEKITLAPTGQIAQSAQYEKKTETSKTGEKTTTTHVTRLDAIRPVMIEGRPYVFWVERAVTGLPSADDTNQTPTKYRKISVQYIFKQSDGAWSAANELLCLDGTKDGKRLPDYGNAFLKDDTFEPGLIALVNGLETRADDPWLMVMLYDSSKTPGEGNKDKDYFIAARDLLLLEDKQLTAAELSTFIEITKKNYKDIRNIQKSYEGNSSELHPTETIKYDTRFSMQGYDANFFSTATQLYEKLDYEYLLKPFRSDTIDFPKMQEIYGSHPYPTNTRLTDLIGRLNEHATKSTKPKQSTVENNLFHDICPNLPEDPRLSGQPNGTAIYIEKFYEGRIQSSYRSDRSSYRSVRPSKPIGLLWNLYKEMSLNVRTSSVDQDVKISSHLKKVLHLDKKNVKASATIDWNGQINGASCSLSYTENFTCDINKGHSLRLLIKSPIELFANHSFSGEPDKKIPVTKDGPYALELMVHEARLLFDPSFRIKLRYKEDTLKIPLKISITSDCQALAVRLYAKTPSETELKLQEKYSLTANGSANFTYDYKVQETGEHIFTLCEAGDPLNNVSFTYFLTRSDTTANPVVSIQRNTEQAQYLDLSTLNQNNTLPQALRLNTLFGKHLISRAMRSGERVLEWDTQMLQEPAISNTGTTGQPPASQPVDFYGANGAYFRELFLHLTAMVAMRLSEQQQFDDAEDWYSRYLFDPYRTGADDKGRPPFWNTRALRHDSVEVLSNEIEPALQAFSLSAPYRRAIFLAALDNLQRQGDHFYRQLTPDSLNQAWQCYQKAIRLLGTLPERLSVSRWKPLTLNNLEPFAFRAPINSRLTQLRDTLRHRLHNLRHGLTLNGKRLPRMDLSNVDSDPFNFAQRGIGQLITRYNSDQTDIPAYRFRQLIPMARSAVQQLQDLGRHYMKLMEDEFNTTLSVLLKEQEIRISDFTLKLKQEAINAVEAKKRTLDQSRRIAVARKDFYEQLINVGRSPIEEMATVMIYEAAVLKSIALPIETVAGYTDSLLPKIWGMAFGGNNPSATAAKVALTLEVGGDISRFIADQLLIESGYERRAEQWRFEHQQAELDIESIDLQLKETEIERRAANISLDESRQERANLEEAYVAMTTGFTIIPIYNWLVARQELLYSPAHDAVLSLCQSAEAAWRYEIGDYQRPAFIKPGAWRDDYKGMLAGESLLVDLQEMENAYLQSNERRLTIQKSFGMRAMYANDKTWQEAIARLKTGPLSFEFKARDFDEDFPGHYLRQLKHVSVSFVMASTAVALENVSAILTQTSSSTLVEPLAEGVEYLYKSAKKTPECIKRNLRGQQQIALSAAVEDDGLGLGAGSWVYELMFHDGRYLPFEGTGAISSWQLSIPGKRFVESLTAGGASALTDIRINLLYTAVDGGSEMKAQVGGLMSEK